MKTIAVKFLSFILTLMLAMCGMVGCSNASGSQSGGTTAQVPSENDAAGPINVVSREEGSGTRSAFVELFEVQIANADGKKVDATTLDAVITNSTSVMLATVAGDVNAIGYISLGSLNNTVTALEIDGVAATSENVKSGAYGISRPFNIATKGELSDAAQDFINFILSAEGQRVVSDNHYIAVVDNAPAYRSNGAHGKVVVAGSSSVTPVMEKLKEAYAAVNPNVTIEINQSDSSTGMANTIDGICDIGMSSRALKDSEISAGLTATKIAMDGIAVIINNNRDLRGLTREQVREIFLGNIVDWSDI